MIKAYLFPGQGSQYVGMGRALYDDHPQVKVWFEKANQLLDMNLTKLMFEGPEEKLRETRVAQPAIFVCSVAQMMVSEVTKQAMVVAGHSLGEITALVVAEVITPIDGLYLIRERAKAMEKACQMNPGTMAAVLGLKNEEVEQICKSIKEAMVRPANYNSPGQLVISGSELGVKLATKLLIQEGAKRVVPLKVAGAFHTRFMEPAYDVFYNIVDGCSFKLPICPVYQNVTGLPTTSTSTIRLHLVNQLVAPVCWTQIIENMAERGVEQYITSGPGNVLDGLVRKNQPQLPITNLSV